MLTSLKMKCSGMIWSGSMQTPITTTWPHLSTRLTASLSVDLTPIHSNTTSGSLPHSSLTLAPGLYSRGLTTALAPSPSASSRRPGAISDTTTGSAPVALHHSIVARPTGPAPITIDGVPGLMRERLTPCNPTDNGSTSAPWRELSRAGSLSRLAAGQATYSAYAPGSGPSPIDFSFSQ